MAQPTDRTYSIRTRKASDDDALTVLSEAADMGTFPFLADTLVAVDASDAIIGFLRITRHEGDAYVNPVVVDKGWRGYGVGESLMRKALEPESELLFVARGEAVGFYQHLGCEAVPWERIAPAIAEDCDCCPSCGSCKPSPMRMIHNPS